MKKYAGIGSRKTPLKYISYFRKIGEILAKKDYILRSGHAAGADQAFEDGCDSVEGKKEIFLPWKDFNGSTSTFYILTDKAEEIAKKFHPGWDNLSDGSKKLHIRNSYQILGSNCDDPVLFVVCYGNPELGGTSQALRIAKSYSIPIFNFYYEEVENKDIMRELIEFIKKIEFFG